MLRVFELPISREMISNGLTNILLRYILFAKNNDVRVLKNDVRETCFF